MTMAVAAQEQRDELPSSGGGEVPTRRSARKSAAGVDYKALAGEDVDSPEDLTKSNGGGGGPAQQQRRRQRHANRHVGRILEDAFSDPAAVLQTLPDGSALTSSALLDPTDPLSIHRPILVTDAPESIGMRVPRGRNKGRITIRGVGDAVGMHHPVTVMDVRTQEELDGWAMSDLVDYFEDEDRKFLAGQSSRGSSPRGGGGGADSSRPESRVLNQISLEFSHTPLLRQTRSPAYVRDLDWIDNLWPAPLKSAGDYPIVQYYCLTSTAGCYTDFHVDFGGTSVWYHVLSGEKVFLLAPPTPSNMKVYEEWLCRPDQAEVFYPDLDGVDGVIKVTLSQDQTLHIPSGWVHAVYTPVDSIVVGGNFLHGLAIAAQLDVYCVETRTRVQAKFRFPHFVRMMFFAGAGYLERMRAGTVCGEEVDGIGRLAEALRVWSVAPAGDADRVGSVAGTAAECARRVGCQSAGEMVDEIEAEVGRIGREGIVPARGYAPAPKLKLSLRVGGGSSPPRPNAADGTSPRPKLKLKLGGLGADGAAAASSTSEPEPSGARSKDDVGDDDDDDDDFRITVAPGAAAGGKKKRTTLHSDLDPYRGDGTGDAGDDEWMPEAERRRKGKKLAPSLAPPAPLRIDPPPPEASTTGPSSRAPLRSPKSNSGVGRSMTARQQQQSRPQKSRPAAAAAQKQKKVLTARERLKKKMKF